MYMILNKEKHNKSIGTRRVNTSKKNSGVFAVQLVVDESHVLNREGILIDTLNGLERLLNTAKTEGTINDISKRGILGKYSNDLDVVKKSKETWENKNRRINKIIQDAKSTIDIWSDIENSATER